MTVETDRPGEASEPGQLSEDPVIDATLVLTSEKSSLAGGVGAGGVCWDRSAVGGARLNGPTWARFSRLERILLILVGVGIIALLLVARSLTPSPSGIGTHQSLGFPPCGFITIFGVPCPSCGMTTSWAWLTRGNLIQSWRANPGGLALGLFVGTMGPWMLVSGLRGRWWPWDCQPIYVLAAGLSVLVIAIVQWVIRIM